MYFIYGITFGNLIFSIVLFVRIFHRKEAILYLPTIAFVEAIAILTINLISIHYVFIPDSTDFILSQIHINNKNGLTLTIYVSFGFILVVFAMYILRKLIRHIIAFEHICMPSKTMKIENDLSSKQITEDEALTQKRKLFQTDDFYRALEGAANWLLRISIGNLLVLIVVIISFIVMGYLTNKEDPSNAMVFSWRFPILVCNGFLTTLPALFMELSVFNSTLKSRGLNIFGEKYKS
ncbi:MAG: FHIPEP family type III secretion protein [Clostridiales bacterium]|jgi:flagellar biosynthesis component FlhA|nr:FHIPEP family type III secretion protein [Clostridiales bacterium]